jgi:phenylalanyl-tRNA synthetase beta chain
MKISYRWLQELLPNSKSAEDAGAVLTATGLEVEGIESKDDVPGGLRGLVVGHIVSCEKHPDADRLQVCQVNIGAEEMLQIVCGAVNARAGLHVIVAQVGSTLHPTSGEPFPIKKGKIRGQVSLGMICAEDEIGVGESHEGIIELEANWKPGTPAAEVYGIGVDHVLEIGLTPNRTDGMSHWGVARDLRAGLEFDTVEGCQEKTGEIQMPEVSPLPTAAPGEFNLSVNYTEGCATYLGLVVEGIAIGPSPTNVQRRLRAIGVTPQNNVVDATNYVLHELGQPLHAFDADAIAGGAIHVRRAHSGEELTTLDGVTRELHVDDMVIADSDKALCLAGVYGGQNSGVQDSTKRVLLESAYFDPVVVRKMARRHGLSTDASFRFERGVDPDAIRLALARAAFLLQSWSGAHVSELSEAQGHALPASTDIELDWSYLTNMVGIALAPERVLGILNHLDIQTIEQSASSVHVRVPAYRRDVTRPADLVEEILRVHGFDKIPMPKRIASAMQVRSGLNSERFRNQIAHTLVGRGFQEIMSNSMTKLAYAEALVNDLTDQDILASEHIALLNPLSTDLGAMRQSLLFQGLEAIARNRNFQKPDLRLFELGRTYRKNTEDASSPPASTSNFQETERLSLWMTGRTAPENWNAGTDSVGFYQLKEEALTLLDALGVPERSEVVVTSGVLSDGVQLMRGDQMLGRMGIVNPQVTALCDVQQPVFWADFLLDALMVASNERQIKANDLPKFPSVRRDLSLILEKGTPFGAIRDAAWQAEKHLLKKVGLFDVYEGDNLNANQVSYAVSLTLQDERKTLTDKRIDQCVQRILESITNNTGAQLR